MATTDAAATDDYWRDNDFSAARAQDELDDDDSTAGPPATTARAAAAAIDLDAKGTHLARVLGAEDVPPDHAGLFLGGELVNCQVDKARLLAGGETANKLMRFVAKVASSAPVAKGREKRQLVVAVSAEFPPRLAPPNPAAVEFTECGRTDTSYDDAGSTFALPVRVLCRKGTDRLVRVQVVWSQSNLVTGGDATVLGQHVERFSELWAKTASLRPLRFDMASPACPKAGPPAHALLWRLPFAALKPPCTPFVDLAARRHVSYSVPYLFRRRESGDGGPTGAGRAKLSRGLLQQQQQQQSAGAGDDADLGPEDLILARETALESRLPYRLAALIFRPFVKQMEGALAAWQQRLEQERVDQGYFTSEAEAFKHGRVLVRLTVVEAAGLPPLRDDLGDANDFAGLRKGPGAGRGGGTGDGSGGGGGGGSGGGKASKLLPSVVLSQQAQKLAAVRAAAPSASTSGGGGGGGSEKAAAAASHPFVTVTMERPRPQVGLLVGHTNTEYGTQAPVFGRNAQPKACPHGGKAREAFVAAGAAKLLPGAGGVGQQPAFLFYAPKADVDKTHLRFEVFHESPASSHLAQLAATGRALLDGRHAKAGALADHPDAAQDSEAWLPLLDRAGQTAGRLLVRVALFTAPSPSPTTTSSASSARGPVDLLCFDAPPLPAPPVTVKQPPSLPPTAPAPAAPTAADTNTAACYEWTGQAGFSGKPPRACDAFTGAAAATTGSGDRAQLRYPLEWLRLHVDSLAKELATLQSALRLWEQAAADGRGFRSSEHKVAPELQGVATNVHSQTFVLADLGGLLAAGAPPGALVDSGSSSSSTTGAPLPPASPAGTAAPTMPQDLLSGLPSQPPVPPPASPSSATTTPIAAASSAWKNRLHYYDLVSAGAPTAHALGFRSGGLLSHHAQMVALQREMLALDAQVQALAGEEGLYLPTGGVGELCLQLQAKLLTFEAMLAKTAVRRLLCISQALGVAATSLAAKLDIMLTEDADPTLAARTAHSMVKGGFLVCFQGLISTIGKEHGMLEDVAVAMELASQYAFELRAKRQSGHTRSPTPLPFPTTTNSGLSGLEQDLLLAFDSPQRPSPSSPVPPMPPSSYTTTTTNKHAGSQNSPLAMEVEFDEAQKRVRLLLEPAALDRLPPTLKAAMAESGGGGLVVPIVALLFCQGIDVHQSFANLSNQLKGKGDKEKEKELPASASAPPSSSSSSSSAAAASSQPGGADSAAAGEEGPVARAGTGKGSKKVGGDSTIQPIINRRSLKILNDYCHRCHPVATSAASPAAAAAAFDRFAERFDNARAATAYGSQEEFVRSVDEIPALHPLLASLRDALRRDNGSHKNVELLREQERVVLELGGGQVIFCKSGKDRTGMAVTLHQARLLGDRHGCGAAPERLGRDANTMRLHGTRLLICDKNVGHLKYAFNKLQLQFMPAEYRPPTETIFEMMESILNRDTT